MKKAGCVLGLALCALWAPDRVDGRSDKKPTPAPFYRQYLIPGDPLDEKIVEQEKRVEESPQDANLRNDFGNLLAERRFPAQAAEQYEKAIDLDKKNFISAYNLGLVRETEGKVSSAISAYQRSIKRKPGFPQSRFRLGRLYERTNQPEPAVHEYAAALWIDPAMRDPKHNPLVIDSQLMYLASLSNYGRDVAVASMTDSQVYFDNDRFRKLPTTRAISSKEVESDEEAAPAPRDVGNPTAAPGATGASEPARRAPRGQPPGQSAQPRPNGARRAMPPHNPPGAPAGAPAPATGAPAAVAPPAVVPAPSAPPETVEPAPGETAPENVPEPAVTPPPDVEPS